MRSDQSLDKATLKALRSRRRAATGRLFCEYTFVFVLFFAAVFSPFWLYKKSLLYGTDGMTQYYPELIYTRYWAKSILESLRSGRFDIPLWSLWIGFGQNTLGNIVSLRPLNFLYCLFPYNALEQYLVIRFAIGTYISGLAFLAYGRTRVRNHAFLILGCMIYLFSGILPYYISQHWIFLDMTMALPLMLLGVDRIFEGKWSRLFVFVVFMLALCYFYSLYMVTLPAIVYALFHYFELDRKERSRCGGFGRILLRHVVQYAVGLCLAAVTLLPSLFVALSSCRTAAQKGMNLLLWNLRAYLDYFRTIVDARVFKSCGFIALPSVALVGILFLYYGRRRRHRALAGQIAFYNLAFLIPALTMLFSAFAGKTMRWCYAFTFWVALGTACALPMLRRDDGRGFRFCAVALCLYAAVYMGICIVTGESASPGMAMLFLGFAALMLAMASDRGRRRKRLGTALLFVMLLIELTAKSYEWYSPRFNDKIDSFIDAGIVFDRAADNAASALDLVSDDAVYRTDIVTKTRWERSLLANYGVRDHVNGVSSYYNLNTDRTVTWSTGLGNAHQMIMFKINDLDQRTVLDELAGVKYVAALEDGLNRIPYGYEQVASRTKRRSNGRTTTAYVFRNNYALPLAYAYECAVSPEYYAALPPNRKEQAMLQGVVLEADSPLEKAELKFDDVTLLGNEAVQAILARAAEADGDLEVKDGVIRVKRGNYSVSIPVVRSVGEMYLQFRGLHYRSVDFAREEAEERARADGSRRAMLLSRLKALRWIPIDTTIITAACGDHSDQAQIYGAESSYYYGERDVLFNLGCGEIEGTLTLSFSEPGEYSFDGVELICQPMDAYPEKVAPLLANGAVSTAVDGNRVALEFDLERDAFACLAIPWSEGWSARVDGEKAQVLPANGMYMGVMLPAGEHTVEFCYRPKGLVPGAIISLATLAALILVPLLRRRRRRRSLPAK